MADAPQAHLTGLSSLKLMIWTVVGVLVIFVFPETSLLVAVGMLPTIIAYIIDNPPRFLAWSVGGVNLAGVSPAVGELWSHGNSVAEALSLAGDAFNLIVMYGAAAFGWALYLFIPPVVISMLAVTAHHRIGQLRSDQRALIQEWGPEIAASPKRGRDLSASLGFRESIASGRIPRQILIRSSITALRMDFCSFSKARTSI